MQELCIPERQVVGWFDIIDKERFQPENFPVFIIHDDRGYYYGFPPFENPGDNTISSPVSSVSIIAAIEFRSCVRISQKH